MERGASETSTQFAEPRSAGQRRCHSRVGLAGQFSALRLEVHDVVDFALRGFVQTGVGYRTIDAGELGKLCALGWSATVGSAPKEHCDCDSLWIGRTRRLCELGRLVRAWPLKSPCRPLCLCSGRGSVTNGRAETERGAMNEPSMNLRDGRISDRTRETYTMNDYPLTR